MLMAKITMLAQIRCKWWLAAYIKTLMILCVMMRCEPDYEKVSAFIVKYGMSVKLMHEPEEASKEE